MLINSKELIILDILLKNSAISQRELARTTGVSLGLINVILKKLLRLGYINVLPLNKRRFKYLLTPEGVFETAQKMYGRTNATIKNYLSIQSNLINLLKNLQMAGYEYFSIQGDGELRELIESTFKTHPWDTPITLGNEHRADTRAVVLNITADAALSDFKGEIVNVFEKIGS